ncbi:MAG TPA: ThuA domain-containing protein [Tepidisphaeraceae bacterium]|jgi:trehalose utilization protein|nr:ThuA domain-containing protein [Tepidisphaeraceae bacterium]
MAIRVTVWHEHRHEKINTAVAAVYPQGMHEAIANYLRRSGDLEVRTALLDAADNGLPEDVLNNTDVLTWWGHGAHHEVSDLTVERVYRRVHDGMGLIVLHSGHHSKIFRKLMGTGCDLKWRVGNDREVLWVTRPGHPITEGIEECIILEQEEMYGEFFDVPEPLETVFISNFSGGEVFRSGLTYQRGQGSIFYFRPGHETYPTYHNPQVMRVIENAIRWAVPRDPARPVKFGHHPQDWMEKKKSEGRV